MYKLVGVRRSPLPLGKGRPPLTPPLNYSLYTSCSGWKMCIKGSPLEGEGPGEGGAFIAIQHTFAGFCKT